MRGLHRSLDSKCSGSKSSLGSLSMSGNEKLGLNNTNKKTTNQSTKSTAYYFLTQANELHANNLNRVKKKSATGNRRPTPKQDFRINIAGPERPKTKRKESKDSAKWNYL